MCLPVWLSAAACIPSPEPSWRLMSTIFSSPFRLICSNPINAASSNDVSVVVLPRRGPVANAHFVRHALRRECNRSGDIRCSVVSFVGYGADGVLSPCPARDPGRPSRGCETSNPSPHVLRQLEGDRLPRCRPHWLPIRLTTRSFPAHTSIDI